MLGARIFKYSLAVLICVNAASAAELSATARSQLRFRLENLSSDIELAIRNHRSDELDLRTQAKIESTLKIGERIPFQPRIGQISRQLTESARESGIRLSGFRLTGRESDPDPVPEQVTIGEISYRLAPGQVAESIGFRIIAQADRLRLVSWIQGWHDSMMRVMEPTAPIRRLADGHWEIRGRAFRFRNVRFPALRFADPRSLLPEWARNDPGLFVHQEPRLARLLQDAEKNAPSALPWLEVKRRFLLEDARIGFFRLKAGAPPDVRIN